jgi:hypothetical protein
VAQEFGDEAAYSHGAVLDNQKRASGRRRRREKLPIDSGSKHLVFGILDF